MKIFAFADLHSDFKALERIKHIAKKEKPELILAAGDISIFGSDIRNILKDLDGMGIPVIIIPGNHETPQEIDHELHGLKNIVQIHKKVYRKSGVAVVGYGGGGFSLTEPELYKTFKQLKKHIEKSDKVILLTHQPPYKTNVDRLHTTYAGNKTTRKIIEDEQPELVICGHLHENEGKKDKIGKTRIVNPGYQGMILEI